VKTRERGRERAARPSDPESKSRQSDRVGSPAADTEVREQVEGGTAGAVEFGSRSPRCRARCGSQDASRRRGARSGGGWGSGRGSRPGGRRRLVGRCSSRSSRCLAGKGVLGWALSSGEILRVGLTCRIWSFSAGFPCRSVRPVHPEERLNVGLERYRSLNGGRGVCLEIANPLSGGDDQRKRTARTAEESALWRADAARAHDTADEGPVPLSQWSRQGLDSRAW
jgi:hypothetical protein